MEIKRIRETIISSLTSKSIIIKESFRINLSRVEFLTIFWKTLQYNN